MFLILPIRLTLWSSSVAHRLNTNGPSPTNLALPLYRPSSFVHPLYRARASRRHFSLPLSLPATSTLSRTSPSDDSPSPTSPPFQSPPSGTQARMPLPRHPCTRCTSCDPRRGARRRAAPRQDSPATSVALVAMDLMAHVWCPSPSFCAGSGDGTNFVGASGAEVWSHRCCRGQSHATPERSSQHNIIVIRPPARGSPFLHCSSRCV
jgi:hypothetical protein